MTRLWCPQAWAVEDRIGCKLMSCPELVRDMVMDATKRCGEEFSVSVKIRICRKPVNVEAVKLIKSIATVPIVLNGDMFSIDNVDHLERSDRERSNQLSSSPFPQTLQNAPLLSFSAHTSHQASRLTQRLTYSCQSSEPSLSSAP